MTLKLQERYLYGRMVYYPKCEESKRLLKSFNDTLVLCGHREKKCFNDQQVGDFREEGYEIEIEPFQYFKEGKHQ